MGYAALWIPEAWGREAFSNAQLQLSQSRRIAIATGIANIWGRDAVAAANAARTLNAAYDNRFILGLGVSHAPLVERLRGHQYATPVAAMSSYLQAMDASPSFSADHSQPYAKVIAALGPKMLEVARVHADGAHPYLVTPEHTAIAREALGPNKFIGVEQAVVLGGSRESYLERAGAHLEIYTGLDNYRNSWRRLGFSDDDFGRGGSTRLREAMVVHGDEDAILRRIREHFDAGASHVCLQFLGTDLTTPLFDEWQRVATALGLSS
jgi:probable F420-dependent oxidoreductase